MPNIAIRKEKRVSNRMRSSVMKTVSSFAPVNVTLPGFTVRIGEKIREEMGYEKRNGCFVRNLNHAGFLPCPARLGFACLSIL